MKNENRKDVLLIKDMLLAIENIYEFTNNITIENFATNDLIQAAVERKFEIIGEAAGRVSASCKKEFHNVNWEVLRAFRNFLIHEYHRIDIAQVWTTILSDLPTLKEQMEDILEAISKDETL